MAINLRSPYFTGTIQPNASYSILGLKIWSGSVTSVPSTENYNLRKSAVGTGTEIFFELSELIKDYIDITFNGDYNGQAVWFKTNQTVYNASNTVIITTNSGGQLALDGYWYFEEAQTATPSALISNRELFVLEDNAFRIPIYINNTPTVVFYKDGEVIASETFTPSPESANQIKYVSIYGDDFNYDTFQELQMLMELTNQTIAYNHSLIITLLVQLIK